jgi:hypothetical protein
VAGRREESRLALVWLRGKEWNVGVELDLLEDSYRITQVQEHNKPPLGRLKAILR